MSTLIEKKAYLYKLIESTIIPVILLGLGFYFNPSDPLLLHQTFPWIWLGPVAIALRYGHKYALIAVAMIIAMIAYTIRYQEYLWEDYNLWLLGGLLLTFIAGGAHLVFEKRFNKIARQSKYLSNEFEVLSRANKMLHLSHEFLEQAVITKPVTIRKAVADMSNLLIRTEGQITPDAANQLLQLLIYYAGLEQAAIYKMSENNLLTTPVAFIGKENKLLTESPLVKKCLQTKKNCYVTDSQNKLQPDDYLIAAPLVTSEGNILGILTVTEIPFLMMQAETLKALTILLAYYADQADAIKQSYHYLEKYPGADVDFVINLIKLYRLWNEVQTDSMIVVFEILPNPQAKNIAYELQQQQRVSDITWIRQKNDTTFMNVLLPFASLVMAKGYEDRKKQTLFNKFQIHIGEPPVLVHTYQISGYKEMESLLDAIMRS